MTLLPIPNPEQIRHEIAVSISLRERYGTNQPELTYEDGVTSALLWVLGNGQAPCDSPFILVRLPNSRHQA